MVKFNVEKLTPETLLSGPRRSPGIPNRIGTLALHSVSTHVWGDKTTTDVRVMDIKTAASWSITADEKVHDWNWIPGTDDEIVYFRSGEKGKTEIYVTKGSDKKDLVHDKIAEIDAPVADLKMKKLDDGSIAFVVTGLVGEHGGLFNEEATKKKSSAMIYDTVNIRSWNALYKQNRYSIWYTTLVQYDKNWKVSGELQNLVYIDDIEAPYGKYDVNDPKNFFDVSHKGITFLGRNLEKEKNPDLCVSNYAYFVPIDSYTLPPSQKPKPIATPATSDEAWAGSGIQFSPDAENIAFLLQRMKDGYLARLFMTSVASLDAFDVVSLVNSVMLEEIDPPESFQFISSDRLLLVSQATGRHAISVLQLADGEQPRIIHKEGTLADMRPLEEGNHEKLLISTHSFLDSSLWQILNVAEEKVERVVSSVTKHGSKYGLSKKQVQEVWFSGADDICVQSFVLYPSDFDEKKKYPWVFLPHGGPIAVWSDSWSTRWNMLCWAEQGYIVIAPNITGSTGFGVDFARRIKGQWGGRPFQDCLNLIEYLEKLPYLDFDKAVYAGASYSGYLGSWFFCNDVIKKFCCAVWHDGIFSLPISMIEGDYTVDGGDFEGGWAVYSNQAELELWNPATQERLQNWRNCPPTIVIHSEKDYRCPITEGLATFKTLQGMGVPSRFITFPDEGHWVLQPENSLVWHKEVFSWVERCVNGELKRGDKKW